MTRRTAQTEASTTMTAISRHGGDERPGRRRRAIRQRGGEDSHCPSESLHRRLQRRARPPSSAPSWRASCRRMPPIGTPPIGMCDRAATCERRAGRPRRSAETATCNSTARRGGQLLGEIALGSARQSASASRRQTPAAAPTGSRAAWGRSPPARCGAPVGRRLVDQSRQVGDALRRRVAADRPHRLRASEA